MLVFSATTCFTAVVTLDVAAFKLLFIAGAALFGKAINELSFNGVTFTFANDTFLILLINLL